MHFTFKLIGQTKIEKNFGGANMARIAGVDLPKEKRVEVLSLN